MGELNLGACCAVKASEDCFVAVDGLSGPGDDTLFYQKQGAGSREFRMPAEVSLPVECTDQGQVAGWSAYAGLEGCTVWDEFGDVSCHGFWRFQGARSSPFGRRRLAPA